VPAVIQSDNVSPDFRIRVMSERAYGQGVRLQFIESAKPFQNAFIESFNRRLREGCLNPRLSTVEQFAAFAPSAPAARTTWPADRELTGGPVEPGLRAADGSARYIGYDPNGVILPNAD
jgi:hypothetical protein